MAKSSLTQKQWREIENRYLPPGNEGGRSLALEFGITEGAIRKKFGTQKKQIESVANQLVSAEINFKKLDTGTQVRTADYKDLLLSMSTHLAHAGNYGAAISHRLKGVASELSDKITDFDPLDADHVETLKGINALVRTSNESAHIAIELMKASKQDKTEEQTIKIVGGFD